MFDPKFTNEEIKNINLNLPFKIDHKQKDIKERTLTYYKSTPFFIKMLGDTKKRIQELEDVIAYENQEELKKNIIIHFGNNMFNKLGIEKNNINNFVDYCFSFNKFQTYCLRKDYIKILVFFQDHSDTFNKQFMKNQEKKNESIIIKHTPTR